jgi:putative ABC transport system ATP-binding protein
LVPFLTVGENLRLAAEVRDMPVDKTMLGEALERAGASSIGLARMPATLSGGEQQRVVIARTLIHDAEVVLADEPTGSLDSENSLIIANQLAAIGRSGKVVVVATHDPAVMATLESSLRLVDGVLEGERVTV